MSRTCRAITLALLCLFPWVGAAAEDPKLPDAVTKKTDTLKAVRTSNDDSSLLEFFRRRTLNNGDPEQIKALVRQLGDGTFKVRQKASAELIALGMIAKPYLVQATRVGDPEVVRRAEECLEQIRPDPARSDRTVAAIRRLVARKPAGAVATLLAFLPFAENSLVTEELEAALASLSAEQTEDKKVLLAALTDRLPVRRAAAAEAICRWGKAEALTSVASLLQDADDIVRARAAMALARAGDHRSVPVLISLLNKLPQGDACRVEDLLLYMAGDRPPPVSLGSEAATKKKCQDAWLTWWKDNEARVDLAKLKAPPPFLNYTLIVELDAGVVQELGPDNKPRFEILGLKLPLDAQILQNGRVLITESDGHIVTERDTKGNIVWSLQVRQPLMAQRLPNGNTFIASRSELIEVDREGKQVFSYTRPNGELFMKAQKLPNGEIACVIMSSVRTSEFIQLDPAGRQLQSFPVMVATSGGRIDVLPNGRVLVPEKDRNRVAEYDQNGKAVWEVEFPQPVAAVRLPNGNTLVTSFNAENGVPLPAPRLLPAVELDQTGKVVWEYGPPTRVTRAFRR